MPERAQRLFSCAGDVQFEDAPPTPGLVVDVRLKPFSETCNYLQYKQPLTRKHPCFFAQIRSLTLGSIVTVGIAGPDIHDDVHPGNWNGTLGYRNTGRCYTSHVQDANTEGERFAEGDLIGVLVTHFGGDISTVVFLKNAQPVATRYLFEPDHNNFLPTITLENGPIDLGVTWPEAVTSPPHLSQAEPSSWIRPEMVQYDHEEKLFTATHLSKPAPELIIQSPLPLTQAMSHYEVVVREVSDTGAGPTIGIGACSPLNPPSTCPLLSDHFHWHPDGKLLKTAIGQRLGWGVHYDPGTCHQAGFSDKDGQLVLCYVTMDAKIMYSKMVMQPSGGWYPMAMLHPYASKLEVDLSGNPGPPVDIKVLDELFNKLAPEAWKVVEEDKAAQELEHRHLNYSKDLQIQLDGLYTKVVLPREAKGVHFVQLTVPLKPEQSYFCADIRRMGDSSVVCLGISGSDFPQGRYPGRYRGTVGYQSRDGKMYYNDKEAGNTTGQRYGNGDRVGVEIEVFGEEMSVALFSRNGCPIGTRFLTQSDHSQFQPTVAICGNGTLVEIDILWQTRISRPPLFNVTNLEHWCLPEGAKVDQERNTVYVEDGHMEAEAIQAPYSLHRSYNHFEVELVEDFSECRPPPAIALCTACPFDPTPNSNFRQDFIRFWATGPAAQAVSKGDTMGWGLLYPDPTTDHDAEQLVICYLTINRDVVLTRVMFQPPGGFYPVILMPPGVDKVKLNFGATLITQHPFTQDAISHLLHDAQRMIDEESRKLAQGTELEIWDSEENKAKYLKPVPTSQGGSMVDNVGWRFLHTRLPGIKNVHGKQRMTNLVELMHQAQVELKQQQTVLETQLYSNGQEQRRSSAKDAKEAEKPRNSASRTCCIL